MKIILDTCVVSELARENGLPRVRAFVANLDDGALHLSVITIGEIRHGIARLDDGRRKQQLTDWLLALERDYVGRILPIDTDVAHTWGQLTADAKANGRTLPVCDGLIAATGLQHGMTIATRNVADFLGSGVKLVNPWDDDGARP